MSRVSFDLEWEDAPGVRDQVLARTWARLVIRLDGHIVTRALDLRAHSERTGVYGPMFPLAEWLVENFWFVTSEIPRSKKLSGRHHRFAPRSVHQWMLRHNLLGAGAGAALPDLTFASDGSTAILAAWFPDPHSLSERRTLRFLGEGRARLSVHDLQAGIAAFVNSVMMRLENFEFEEVMRLRRDWLAISDSMKREERLCRQLAKLGLDPYGVEDEHIDTLEAAIASVPEAMQSDLLESESLEKLVYSAGYALKSSDLISQSTGPVFRAPLTFTSGMESAAHEIGYRLAHEFRKTAGIPHDRGVPDLETVMTTQAVAIHPQSLAPPNGSSVRGVVGFSSSRTGVLVTPHKPAAALRFLLGRALGACLLGQCEAGPRLLTDALTWDQAAARAFSAELLAPHAALAQRVGGAVSSDEVQALASEFQVSELVVAHQIENHQLAMVVPD